MRQMYYCPNCRASVSCGARFCGSCGISLNWVVEQMPPPSSPLASGNLKQYQQQHMNGNRGTISQSKSSSQDAAVTPISIEISKLLADFFGKQTKCQK